MKKILFFLLLFASFAGFAQKTDSELNTQANQIKNETTPGANTATRIGNMFLDIIASKVNNENLTWEEVLNKPTTLAGFGITDGVPSTRTINSQPLTSNITLTASNVGAVPIDRTVNGHDLGSNVTVTASDVGLGNVNNTSDLNKPISTATQTALDGKAANTITVNGHPISANVTVTKSDVGLGNADNTSDLNKPISTATQTALDGKVATTVTVNGHALSSNVTVTASDVGLGSVDNTSDVTKRTIVFNTVTNDYTLVLSDFTSNTEIRFNKSSNGTITIPPNASVALPVGATIRVKRINASGILSFVAGSGVTINASGGSLTDAGLNTAMRITQTSANVWDLDNGSPGAEFSYIPTATGFLTPPTFVGSYSLIGKQCTAVVNTTVNGTSNATTFTITLPFSASTAIIQYLPIRVTNNGAVATAVGMLATRTGSNIADLFINWGPGAGGAWTSSNGKGVNFAITYIIQ